MKRISIIGLCLMAAMAISAVTVASASAALPEFKTAKFPVKFTAESLLPLEPVLHSVVSGTPINIACTMSKSEGEVTGAKAITKTLVQYTGCSLEGKPTDVCTTSGEPLPGDIMTKVISGEPGYVSVTSVVGILLKPETGSVFATFKCEGTALGTITVSNAVIGEAQPLNLSSKTGELIFEENAAKNGQKWARFVGGPLCELSVDNVTNGWLMDRELETFAAPVELKA
jgi:hypothetical protein